MKVLADGGGGNGRGRRGTMSNPRKASSRHLQGPPLQASRSWSHTLVMAGAWIWVRRHAEPWATPARHLQGIFKASVLLLCDQSSMDSELDHTLCLDRVISRRNRFGHIATNTARDQHCRRMYSASTACGLLDVPPQSPLIFNSFSI